MSILILSTTLQRFFGDYEAFKSFAVNELKLRLPDAILWTLFVSQCQKEYQRMFKFSAGIIKSAIYPVAFLMQILCLIFLIRGNSGYSRSARNWFILGVSADIASFLYLTYEMIEQDWRLSNPFISDYNPSTIFIALMWGLRNPSHALSQDIVCRTFFAVLYFPIYLSPISLTMSSLIRCYSVKFPLRAKAVLTKCTDRALMICAVILALAVSMILGSISIGGQQSQSTTASIIFVLGMNITSASCPVPVPQLVNTNSNLVKSGYFFLMTIGLAISALNMMSAAITVWVLFDARKTRRSLQSTSVTENSNSEIRATMKLLGINVVIFVCFFLSRVFIILQYNANASFPFGTSSLGIITSIILERLGSYLFIIPYCINWLFIAGLDRKFYAYFLRCKCGKESDGASSMQLKTTSDLMTRAEK